MGPRIRWRSACAALLLAAGACGGSFAGAGDDETPPTPRTSREDAGGFEPGNDAAADAARPRCARALGGRGYDSIFGVGVDATGAVVVAGTFEGAPDLGAGPLASADHEAVFVAKLDRQCRTAWTRTFRATTPSKIQLRVDASGQIFLAGTTDIDLGIGAPAASGFFVAKLAPDGAPSWKNVYPRVFFFDDFAVDRRGFAILAGRYAGRSEDFPTLPVTSIPDAGADGGADGGAGGGEQFPSYDIWGFVARLDGAGAPVFAVPLRGRNQPPKIAPDADGNVVAVFGGTIAKLAAADGATLWTRSGGQPSPFALDAAGNIYFVAPWATGVTKLSPTGDFLWKAQITPEGFPTGPSSYAVSPSGQVHFATVTDNMYRIAESPWLYLASLAPDGGPLGTGVYGAPSPHREIHLATGADDDLVAAGGFAGPDVDFGGGAVASAYAPSAEGFVVRNPSYAKLLRTLPEAGAAPVLSVLEDGPGRIVALSAADGFVAWARSSRGVTLSRCPATGCPAAGPTTLAAGLSAVRNVVARGDVTYAAADALGAYRTVLRCAADACTTQPVTADRVGVGAGEIVLASDQGVAACPLDGCAGGATPVATTSVKSVAAAPGAPGAFPGVACPATGCGSVPRVEAFAPPWAGADAIVAAQADETLVASGRVFVLDRRAARISSCPLAGCGPAATIVASSASGLPDTNLASDGTDLYFFDRVPRIELRLVKCSLSGCPASGPTVLWTTQYLGVLPDVVRVAVDDSRVYFTAVAERTTALVSMPK